MKHPAVFLDRDNTIIHNDGDLGDPELVKLIQGVAPAIASVCGLGYKVVVVTNQGGVARGKYTEEDVDAVHDRIEERVTELANGARIDAFYFCPFHPQGSVARYKKEHPTRKPKPGMLLQAAEDLDIDLSQSWMVGDALRDIEAGAAAGCRTVLLQADWTDTSLADLRKADRAKNKASGRRKKVEPDFVAKGLVEAVRIIASQRKPEASGEISLTRVSGKRWDAEAMAKLQKQGRKPKPAKSEGATAPEESPAEASSQDPTLPSPSPASPPPPAESATSSKPAATKPRPFVPWTKQEPEPPPLEPVAEPEAQAPAESQARSEESPTPSPSPEAESCEVSESSPSDDPVADTSEPADALPSRAAAPREVEPAADRVDDSDTAEALKTLNKTMRLVLQELRMQRGTSGEFHQLGVAAIVIQAIALICMLAALWMGGGEGGTAAFLRWIGVAIVLQLGVIATLLFSKPSS